MSWTKVTNLKPHHCDIPYYKDQGVEKDDVIRCNECDQLWLCEGYEYGVQWDPYPVPALRWKRV
jgi:hypothetical protein